jgi:hypothetical protein
MSLDLKAYADNNGEEAPTPFAVFCKPEVEMQHII